MCAASNHEAAAGVRVFTREEPGTGPGFGLSTSPATNVALLAELGGEEFLGARILVIDDEEPIHAIMRHILCSRGFEVVHAHSAEQAIELMAVELPDVIVCDVMMPGMDGMTFCRKLKADYKTALLPVLLMTSLDSSQDRVDGFESGADEFLSKPFREQEMVARIRGMLRTKYLFDQLENAEEVIFSLARAVEAKDAYTGEHIERVSSLAVRIGQYLGSDAKMCAQLLRGGILHDIGKIAIPDSILNKPGALTPEEFECVKVHPEAGERICSSLKTLQPVLDIIRHHHERLDGSGYPDGLVGDEISLPARIMVVCDTFDALATTRSYRKAMSVGAALAILDGGVRKEQLDGDVVATLKRII